MDDSVRHAEAIYHVMLDKFDHIRRLYFLERDGFRPFGEVIGYSRDEPMSFGCWRAYGSNDIHSPHLKWPWRSHWMKMFRYLVNEVTLDLIGMASFNIGDGVRNLLRPIVAMFSKSVPMLESGLVNSAHTVMSFSKFFLCLFVERQQSRISSCDRQYNVCIIIL